MVLALAGDSTITNDLPIVLSKTLCQLSLRQRI
jgi:hypothetical protein